MCKTLWEALIFHLDWSFRRSVCSRRLLKISRMYIFPVLWMSARLLIFISMASLATCLLPLSVTFKWMMLAWGGCGIHCECKLHWLHDCYVLQLYFLDICWTHWCKIIPTFFRTGPLVNHILFEIWRNFVFRMQKYVEWSPKICIDGIQFSIQISSMF